MGLIHVEIQTEDSDLTTMPNLYVVTNPVKVIRKAGTLVTAEVSLGYDVDHNRIEKALAEAAEVTNLTEAFVHVISLGDFSVIYRVAGFLKDTLQNVDHHQKCRASIECIIPHVNGCISSPDVVLFLIHGYVVTFVGE